MKQVAFITRYRVSAFAVFVLCPLFPTSASVKEYPLSAHYFPLHAGGIEVVGVFTPQDFDPVNIAIDPQFREGFASVSQITNAVGIVRFRMTRCRGGTDDRAVSAYLSKSNYDDTLVMSEILRRAALFVWKNCPKPTIGAFSGRDYDFGLDFADLKIYTPDGALVFEAFKFHSDSNAQKVRSLKWRDFTYRYEGWINYPALAREQAQKLAEQAQREADRQASLDSGILKFKLFLFAAFCFWLYTKREPILRFYYFNFHPHPAAPMVRSLIAHGGNTQNTAREFANVLGEVPPSSRILRKVRLEQTDQLMNQIKATNAAHERALAREAQADAIAGFEREAFHGAQTAMALAVEALEKSKVAYATASALRRRRS